MPNINFEKDDKQTSFNLTRVDGFWFMEIPSIDAKQASKVIQSQEYVLLTNLLNQLFDTVSSSTMFDKINFEIETAIAQLREKNYTLKYSLFSRRNFQTIIDEASEVALNRINKNL